MHSMIFAAKNVLDKIIIIIIIIKGVLQVFPGLIWSSWSPALPGWCSSQPKPQTSASSVDRITDLNELYCLMLHRASHAQCRHGVRLILFIFLFLVT